MYPRDISEIDADIADVRSAISAVVKAGQSYTINSGGSSRQVTLADLKGLRSLLADLHIERDEATGDCVFGIGASW